MNPAKRLLALVILAGLLVPAVVPAGDAASADDTVQGTGVVKSVDAAAGKLTISHDPIKAISWPAMTMGFKVADPKILAGLSAGKKIQFTLKGKDDPTITQVKVIP